MKVTPALGVGKEGARGEWERRGREGSGKGGGERGGGCANLFVFIGKEIARCVN